MAGVRRCPCCGSDGMRAFYEVRDVPVHSCMMLPSEEEALAFPRGDIELCLCSRCGFVSNMAFDDTFQNYNPGYEDQQSFSPTFNSFANRLANDLIQKYDIRRKDVTEIGCGKGDFLALLCELGENRGVGIDPSCIRERIESSAIDRITIIQELYTESHARYTGDMVLCRHTLEHVHPTRAFVQTLRSALGETHGTTVFFEVPDVVIVLEDVVFWDVYYEHCSYFSPGSLSRLFRECGFEILDVYRAYDDQYLLLDARPAEETPRGCHELEEHVSEMERLTQHFSTQAPEQQTSWRRRIEGMLASGTRPVIWGSGSKCVAFMTTLGLRDEIGCVVDINPHRHGKFIPAVGKAVVAPDELREYQPDTIIVMNPIYRDEIKKTVRDMDIDAEIVTL